MEHERDFHFGCFVIFVIFIYSMLEHISYLTYTYHFMFDLVFFYSTTRPSNSYPIQLCWRYVSHCDEMFALLTHAAMLVSFVWSTRILVFFLLKDGKNSVGFTASWKVDGLDLHVLLKVCFTLPLLTIWVIKFVALSLEDLIIWVTNTTPSWSQ